MAALCLMDFNKTLYWISVCVRGGGELRAAFPLAAPRPSDKLEEDLSKYIYKSMDLFLRLINSQRTQIAPRFGRHWSFFKPLI